MQRRVDMDRLQELVRLHRMGTGDREVARLLGMSPKRVGRTTRIFESDKPPLRKRRHLERQPSTGCRLPKGGSFQHRDERHPGLAITGEGGRDQSPWAGSATS